MIPEWPHVATDVDPPIEAREVRSGAVSAVPTAKVERQVSAPEAAIRGVLADGEVAPEADLLQVASGEPDPIPLSDALSYARVGSTTGEQRDIRQLRVSCAGAGPRRMV